MKQPKLGIRLNPYSRQKIAQAVANDAVGADLARNTEEMQGLTETIIKTIQFLYHYSIGEVQEGLLPVVDTLLFYTENTMQGVPITLDHPIEIPYAYLIDASTPLAEDAPELHEKLCSLIDTRHELERNSTAIFERMLDYLEGHKSIRTLLDEVPDVARVLPDEYCEPRKEGKALDLIIKGVA